jgi:hypothetical protein
VRQARILLDVSHWPVPTGLEESKVSKATYFRNKEQRININGRLVHPNAPHGTVRGYRNWTCRCDLYCKARSDQYYASKEE